MNRFRLAIYKNSILLCLSIGFASTAKAEISFADTLHNNLRRAITDSERIVALGALVDYYGFNQFDSSLYYSDTLFRLSARIHDSYGTYLGCFGMFHALNCQGNYPRALEAVLNMRKAAIELQKKKPALIAMTYYFEGILYREMADFPKAIQILHRAIFLQDSTGGFGPDIFGAQIHLGLIYRNLNQSDSALWYEKEACSLALQTVRYRKFYCFAIAALGLVYETRGDFQTAENCYRIGIEESKRYNNIYFLARNYNNLAALVERQGKADSSIYYAGIALQLCRDHNFQEFLYTASSILSQAYQKRKNADSAVKYMQIMIAAKDSAYSQSRAKKFQEFVFDQQLQQQEQNAAREKQQQTVRMYYLLAILAILSFLAFILYRNNRMKQKANKEIEKAYKDLKDAQTQLIQQEKMVALGELTAGVAHEIQNPLNFVNNFSEVSSELLTEMNEELKKGNNQEAISIGDCVKENLEKIRTHGHKAEMIVKGMLRHSQSANNSREATDINAFAEEYLQLAYHGIKARENNFEAVVHTSLDPDIQTLTINRQDIGNVLLNIFGNAFYTLAEKKKELGAGFEPGIWLGTKRCTNKIELVIRDNGKGIPAGAIEKIFQPFFTTKPTGQGTGLGLFLSYDIIKAAKGEIKVTTQEGEGTTFTIDLPYTN